MNFYDDIDIYGSNTAAILEDSEIISYNSLLAASDELKRNLKKRCLAFCFCENSLEALVGYLGFLRAKVVPIMMSNEINVSLLNNLLNLYKPQYVWVPKNKVSENSSFEKIYCYRNYFLFRTNYDTDYTLNDELAVLLTTSGSTGSPKLVMQSYKNITSNAQAISEYLEITSHDRPITTLPMSYTYGLSIINSHLLKGASIILTNKTLIDRGFWQLLKENKATTFGGVPYIYEMLKKLRFSRMELPSLKVLTQAGGKLSYKLSSEFADICSQKGIRFYVMYGQTEATARMAYLPSKYAKIKAGSIGIAIPGGEFWLEDEKGDIIHNVDTVGELIYKGENVTLGYAESCADLCRGDTNKGILRTGDMAKRDEDGFYYIVGRKKRFLKLFGSRVNLDEMEQLLKNAGFECACAGKDDNLKIYITDFKNNESVKRFVMKHTGINQAGFKTINIDKIPRNEAGKILYSVLN